MNKSLINIWLMAFRPKTLTAAIAPVLIGTCMAFGDGVEHFPTAFTCLFAALAIQIGTNIANDYYDFKKGADTNDRVGPVRVTQAGFISPETTKKGFIIAFTLAVIASTWLVYRGGWPILIIGIFAILSGIFYTAGSKALGYIGLGDVFVFIFFGPVAVAGTYYVQSLEMNLAVILAGFGPGFISAAILAVNNLRDMETDLKSNKRTLAVRFGRSFTLNEYLFCLLAATLMPVLIYGMIIDHMPILMCVLINIFAIPTIKTVFTKTDGPSLNNALAATGKLLLIYSILFGVGWCL